MNSITREAWLQNGVQAITPLFTAKGYRIPPCHVSCGFASTDVKRGHVGQCWSTGSSEDLRNQIFISPTLGEPFQVLDTLMHELIHAVDNCKNRHGPIFKKMALTLGMTGPMRSAHAAPELKIKLEAIAMSLGPYPHSTLTVVRKLTVRAPRPKAECGLCGFTVPMLKAFIQYGPPICPKDRIEMQALGDWGDGIVS